MKKRLKTKIDIVLFIATVKSCKDEDLHLLVQEFKRGEFEIV